MKNLAKHKDKVNARELLIQAMYEFSFGHNKSSEIEKSFLKDFTKTKVDYIFFKNVFSHATKNFEKIKLIINEKSELDLFGIKKIDLMEENLMVLAISEQETESTPKSIIIDESVRLAKKFGTENSYKFVNATLEKILN
jgi:N utilization substance protein B|tara:strand:+ start:364 stop:780 length:417 start_codon:yes stop_codon:yes gene_type:complete